MVIRENRGINRSSGKSGKMVNQEKLNALLTVMKVRGLPEEDVNTVKNFVEEMQTEVTSLIASDGQFSQYARQGKLSLLDSRFQNVDRMIQSGIIETA